jgi:hypothetical protein
MILNPRCTIVPRVGDADPAGRAVGEAAADRAED